MPKDSASEEKEKFLESESRLPGVGVGIAGTIVPFKKQARPIADRSVAGSDLEEGLYRISPEDSEDGVPTLAGDKRFLGFSLVMATIGAVLVSIGTVYWISLAAAGFTEPFLISPL